MGIFSQSSPFDQIVEKATLETNTKEDWALILDICDRVGTTSQAPKECLRSIMKRLNNHDPHVAIQAITLLDACVSNCGVPFHLEIASRDFEQEYKKLINKTQERTIRDKLLQCLQKWAEHEFRSDPALDLIPSLYHKLKSQGVEFPPDSNSPAKTKKSHGHKSKEHHHSSGSSGVASSAAQQEADDLAKAIELSLKETSKSPQSRSLYPSVASAGSAISSVTGSSKTEKESRKVRALYDFEAAEDNELTFYAGEIIHVIDDSDTNWWEGTNQRGQGLFPSNFVTADLSAEPPKFETSSSSKKQVQFSEEVVVKAVETEPAIVEIDEAKIDHALQILHNVDPTGEIPDPLELAPLEEHVQQMGPLIDQELEQIDRRHAQLTRLGSELVDALNMYHNLMRGQPLMNSPYQQPPPMINKLPGGPPSLTNFQSGMMPGYSPYYDPTNGGGVPQMINHQAMPIRPPQHSAPLPPNNLVYSGHPPPQQMMMNGPPGGMASPMGQQMNQLQQQQQQMPPMNGQNMGQMMPPIQQQHQQQQPQQIQQHHHQQIPQQQQQQLPPPQQQQQQHMMNNMHQVPPPTSNNNIQQLNSMPPQGMLPHQGY